MNFPNFKNDLYLTGLLTVTLTSTALATNPIPACNGTNNLLALVDRPSIAVSPCAAAKNDLLIEAGYAYQNLTPQSSAHNFPQLELRYGLTHHTEIDVLPSNYNILSNHAQSGFDVSGIGLKHVIFFDAKQILTFQGIITVPSGNRFLGTQKAGFFLNGIYSNNLTTDVGISAMLGISSQTDSPIDGGKSYLSVNPIALISKSIEDKISTYLEFYAQSKTASNQGWGIGVDGGIIFLVTQNMTLDFSYGQRVTGAINNVKRYIGGGFVIRMG